VNYLGIDYGEKKTGVAIAEGPLADPFATFPTESALESIHQLVRSYSIEAVIIGDCPAEFSQFIRGWGVSVYQTDETLSSHEAREALLHTTRRKRKENEHAVAAAIILQTWLDANLKPV
jgi:RNase H-fold protein (predicted Holliday junction resolvase)